MEPVPSDNKQPSVQDTPTTVPTKASYAQKFLKILSKISGRQMTLRSTGIGAITSMIATLAVAAVLTVLALTKIALPAIGVGVLLGIGIAALAATIIFTVKYFKKKALNKNQEKLNKIKTEVVNSEEESNETKAKVVNLEKKLNDAKAREQSLKPKVEDAQKGLNEKKTALSNAEKAANDAQKELENIQENLETKQSELEKAEAQVTALTNAQNHCNVLMNFCRKNFNIQNISTNFNDSTGGTSALFLGDNLNNFFQALNTEDRNFPDEYSDIPKQLREEVSKILDLYAHYENVSALKECLSENSPTSDEIGDNDSASDKRELNFVKIILEKKEAIKKLQDGFENALSARTTDNLPTEEEYLNLWKSEEELNALDFVMGNDSQEIREEAIQEILETACGMYTKIITDTKLKKQPQLRLQLLKEANEAVESLDPFKYLQNKIKDQLKYCISQKVCDTLSDIKSDLDEANSRVNDIKKEIQEAQKTYDEAKEKHNQAQTDLKKLQNECNQAQENLEKFQNEYNQAQTDLEKLQNELNQA